MGKEESYLYGWPPVGSPLNVGREEQWRHFDNSVNAVSFGFVATAILISMFLVMAIFERFLRPNNSSTTAGPNHGDLELGFNGKLSHPSPKSLDPTNLPWPYVGMGTNGYLIVHSDNLLPWILLIMKIMYDPLSLWKV
ncbi:hypothetical protein GOBAR_DD30457 [Gossypium barbadense]|nr:hypothetical protein GOBAR_DD30457 [Gossypium barbadense]